jgi:chemotaxis protein histidine kinase CheA
VSDIFVSYASADRDRARAIAQALTDQGWSVWWDRTIPPGRQFDEVIEEALDSARCVVVLWSKASVASQWVKTEAAEAMRRKILVPVLIEEVKIPLEFRRLQAADLSTWTGGDTHEEVRKFFASIGTNVGQEAAPVPAPEPRSQPEAAPVSIPRPVPPADPRPAPQPEPQAFAPPPAPRSKSKALLFGAAGIASMVVIAVGYTAYNERVKRQAMEERAERERKAAEEARRAAEEAAARVKLAQEAAAKEAAQRRAEQERRAAEDARRAADAAAAARAKAAQDEAARTKAAADARAAQEAAARAKAAQEEAARQQAAAKQQQQQQQQGGVTMRINWYDHALRFSGTLIGKSSAASLQATVYDIKTGTQIGNYDVPASVTKQGTDFVVSGTFNVPKDSVTPYPHSHTSRLVLRKQNDGSLRYIENCPQVGKQCYR